MSIRALVVDDEPPARRAICQALQVPWASATVTECADGQTAIEWLRRQAFDVAFLDIRVPPLDGFEIIRRIGVHRMPPVVFVTAFEDFALRAFDVRAVDYLIKPFRQERFNESLDRALGRGAAPLPGPGLPIKTAGRTTRVALSTILWIEAASTYVRVHSTDDVHLLRTTMDRLSRELAGNHFLRVHRSAIVNLDHVVGWAPLARGDYEVLLSNGERVRVSRRHRRALLQRLHEPSR